ncbi:MAG: hypothetical protein JWQ07_5780 [Ramlibacter sp.]|jgi:hypothetical protein|nr:hypothetical protein [Ramlibacter sp.]
MIFFSDDGPTRPQENFAERRRNDAAGLLFPVAVLAGLFTGWAYLTF